MFELLKYVIISKDQIWIWVSIQNLLNNFEVYFYGVNLKIQRKNNVVLNTFDNSLDILIFPWQYLINLYSLK
jgi:hypothetical protein